MTEKVKTRFDEIIEWLNGFLDYERQGLKGLQAERYSLGGFKEFLDHLHNPQDSLRLIHIAGSKGKGSTGSLLTSILVAAGYKTGFYSSPHIYEYRERIQLNGMWISRDEFAEIMSVLRNVWREIGSPDSGLFRSIFELLTATAFIYFNRSSVDFAVIETGVGGRLDATNIIKPLLCIITSISYDHQHLLGESLEEISCEKAGIIKPGVPVVLQEQTYECARGIVADAAMKNDAPLFHSEECVKVNKRIVENYIQKLSVTLDNSKLDLHTSMLGEHQVKNIRTSLTAVSALRQMNVTISDDAVVRGINEWHLSGRVEVIAHKPLIILDGAHCPLSIKGLLDTHHELKKGNRVIFLFSLLADKDVKTILDIIKEREPDSLLLCYPAPTPRTISPGFVYELASLKGLEAKCFSDLQSAVCHALTLIKTGKYQSLISCGTFYSISLIKKELRVLLKSQFDIDIA